ncbi:formate dehydrogenase accessory sulfurtransferase FdhD [Methanogenium marinum]|uniref:Formate dehydrogenase accessory sulfurtransferase FdhD n=1 Tax=Methanogenium marinum TaxID=348610 RepID=A0A9Q4KN90_9EURY|nr:formate dehydrogenase accessory sulfurtransferase FdhD [Methanogenium marinum]MDE4907160.1 formate dehydrogenase accessory sulfurtransferase FdhD [Methanogenium marinum]
MYTKRRFKKIIPGKLDSFEKEVVSEAAVTIFVNGRQAVTAMASPDMLKEYATGFLLTESVVSNADEIESIQVEGNKVSILTLNPRKILFSKKTVLSGCGGTASVIDYSTLPSASDGGIFTPERIQDAVSLVKSCVEDDKTGEIHFAGLFTATDDIVIAGDIGRDNALDKAIGAAVLKNISLTECFVAVSGRISSEMIRKCLFTRISIIVSGGETTSLACDIAVESNMTLIGSVSPQKMIIYSGDHRIEGKQN